jgi:hypothetical protein
MLVVVLLLSLSLAMDDGEFNHGDGGGGGGGPMTAKLHWNSVLSIPNACYMCLYIGNFYLTATLDHYKYMKMPISLLPPWIVD